MIFKKGKIAEFRERQLEKREESRRIKEAAKIAREAAEKESYRKALIKGSIEEGKKRGKEKAARRKSGSGVVKALTEQGRRLQEMDRRREQQARAAMRKPMKRPMHTSRGNLLPIPKVEQEKNKMIRDLWDEDRW